MIPTFLGITILVFTILQVVPGGPLEQELLRIRSAMMSQGEVSTGAGFGTSGMEIPEEAMYRLREYYGLHQPGPIRYLIWLGVWPKQVHIERTSFPPHASTLTHTLKSGKQITLSKEGDHLKVNDPSWKAAFIKSDADATTLKVFQESFQGILTGDLGYSYTYSEPVWTLIKERIHISAYFGVISFFLSYLICIPLGILKTIRHNSKFDMSSSIIIFVGYSIPGWILGAVLLVYFGGGSFWDVFPLGEFRSEYFEYIHKLEKKR